MKKVYCLLNNSCDCEIFSKKGGMNNDFENNIIIDEIADLPYSKELNIDLTSKTLSTPLLGYTQLTKKNIDEALRRINWENRCK